MSDQFEQAAHVVAGMAYRRQSMEPAMTVSDRQISAFIEGALWARDTLSHHVTPEQKSQISQEIYELYYWQTDYRVILDMEALSVCVAEAIRIVLEKEEN